MIVFADLFSTLLQAPFIVGLVLGALALILPLFFGAYVFLQNFATKVELAAVTQRAEKIEQQVASSLKHLEDRLSREIQTNRSDSDHRSGELGVKMDALTSTMQLFTNEMSRVVGSLEGRLSIIQETQKQC